MPIHEGKDRLGPYIQWGKHNKKYYYKLDDVKSKEKAYGQVVKQIHAIFYSNRGRKR
jgi:hypothetical protein